MISRAYNNFQGVDFANTNISLSRSPDALNVWKNYESELAIETRDGMKSLATFANKIYGIHFYKITGVSERTVVLIHSGTKLLEWTNYPTSPATTTELFTGMNIKKSQSFTLDNIFYIKDGLNYLEYNGTTLKEVEPTIPQIITGAIPSGGGTFLQQVNVLTPKRKQGFIADGTSNEYQLGATDLDTSYVVTATVNGVLKTEGTDLSVNESTGVVTFNVIPATGSDGADNVIITYSKTNSDHTDRIQKCDKLIEFDNRTFYTGNDEYPNAIFWSELNDPRYIGDLNYSNEGTDLSKIKGFAVGNDALWVFKEPNQDNTTVFYHTPTIDYTYGKTYPSQHSSISTGCVSTGINFNDDIVFFSSKGLEGVTSTIDTEQFVGHRSTLVDSKLLNETNYEDVELAEYKGYLLCLLNNHIYLADSRQKFENNLTIEYEWFYWEMEQDVSYIKVIDNKLYFGNADGEIYTLEDEGTFTSRWTTPSDDFGTTAYLKTSHKRGGVAEVKKLENENIKVYAKTNKGVWKEIGTYSDSKGYIVYKIKEKKWVELQLKFESTEPFSLINCNLQAFVGGYVKR